MMGKYEEAPTFLYAQLSILRTRLQPMLNAPQPKNTLFEPQKDGLDRWRVRNTTLLSRTDRRYHPAGWERMRVEAESPSSFGKIHRWLVT